MTPAAGQGTLVLQTRADDEAARDAASALSDEDALSELTAERSVVGMLDASCATPVGVHARVEADRLLMRAFVGLPDGSRWVRDRSAGDRAEPARLGEEAAQRLLRRGPLTCWHGKAGRHERPRRCRLSGRRRDRATRG